MNPVIHFELPYLDRARAARFYAEAFGWQTQMLGEEMGHYLLLTTATSDAQPGAPAGSINGGMFPQAKEGPPQAPSIVIGVEALEAARSRVIQAGGELLGEAMDIPGVGRYANFKDSEGNRVGLLQPLPGSSC
ncbi:glyoxalase [Paucibacter sp. KBW04]|uniref:VOC family protein n=1 Tax=Paucibacter sp. KBW04 TaxID=2153361 RepID=UPI000F56968A|nr:VOC family protein [Paucibacter sp. KBW04]RQO55400.1 glyoxalase [Paucibacter sp. KBW04]